MLIIGFVSLVLALLYNQIASDPLELFPEEHVPTTTDSELFSDQPETYDDMFSGDSTAKNTEDKPQAQDVNKSTPSQVAQTEVTEPNPKEAANIKKNSQKEDFSLKNNLPTVDGFPTITIDQLRRAVGDDRFVIIDARPETSYEKDHVPGAINIFPHWEEEMLMPAIHSQPQDKKILIYCTSQLCDLGHELASLMQGFGYQNIFIYVPGWEGWVKNGGMGGK